MGKGLNYNSKTLYDVQFQKNVKGYDSLEVDTLLDKVIEDYEYYEKFKKDAKPYIVNLEKKLTEYKKRISDLELEVAKYKKRLDGINENASASKSNIDLLKRIKALESALFQKGVDPLKIK